MVSVCLPSDALSQHLPSYLGFSYLGRGVSLHGCSSKAQPLLLTFGQGYLLRAAPPDLKRGIAPLELSCAHAAATPWTWGSSSQPLLCRHSLALSVAAPDLGRGIAPLSHASAWSLAAGTFLPSRRVESCWLRPFVFLSRVWIWYVW